MYTNLDVKLRIGGRKAPVISKEEFIEKLRKTIANNPSPDYLDSSQPLSIYNIFDEDFLCRLESDLKVEYDCENFGVIIDGQMDFEEDDIESHVVCIKNGRIPVLPVCAGGDWEIPICFFIYYDGKSLEHISQQKETLLMQKQRLHLETVKRISNWSGTYTAQNG